MAYDCLQDRNWLVLATLRQSSQNMCCAFHRLFRVDFGPKFRPHVWLARLFICFEKWLEFSCSLRSLFLSR